MTDANLIAFGTAVFFTAFAGGYIYFRATAFGDQEAPRDEQEKPQPTVTGALKRPL